MSKPKLHFAYANSYPTGVYRQFFERLNDRFDIQALDMHAHNPRYPVSDCWPLLVDEYIAELTARYTCLLYTSPSPRDATLSRMPSSA